MTFITQPNTEGETKDCPNCNNPLVARLKQYKDWPDKIQWQDKDKTVSHYDKDGNCKDEAPKEEPNSHDEKQAKLNSESLDESTKKIVKREAEFITHIKSLVEKTVKDVTIDPHPGMIWEMTALIYKKYFGEPTI